jgi:hypothetical protein
MFLLIRLLFEDEAGVDEGDSSYSGGRVVDASMLLLGRRSAGYSLLVPSLNGTASGSLD